MIRGVHHVAINTPDLDRLLAFYRDVVGFEVVEGARFDWKDSPEIELQDLSPSHALAVEKIRGFQTAG